MRKFLFVPVLLLVVGCASWFSDTTPDQDLAIACSQYNGAGKLAVVFFDAMSNSQRALVDSTIAVVSPICTAWGEGTVVATADLVAAINQSLENMLLVNRSFQ